MMRGPVGVTALGAGLVIMIVCAACAEAPTAGASVQGGAGAGTTASTRALRDVPWLPLPATGRYPGAPEPSAKPRPPVPVPPGTPVCQAGQLEGVELAGGAAGGHVNLPILVRNRATAACVLEGWADMTILDAGGRVLVAAVGTKNPANLSTFFVGWPKLPVLLRPATPPLPGRPGAETGYTDPSHRGQAEMNMEWFDCRAPLAAVLILGLPEGGGQLRVPFPRRASYAPSCDDPQVSRTAGGWVGRDPLSPAGFTWPPKPDSLNLLVGIHAPATVRRGSTLVYQVVLVNHDHGGYRLDPCPDYNEILGRKDVIASYQLNCHPVGMIASGERVTFEMRLAVPATMATGPTQLVWALLDGRVEVPGATAPLTVTG